MSSSSEKKGPNRRVVIAGLGAGAIGAGLVGASSWRVLSQPEARVAVVKADSYDVDLVDILVRSIQQFPNTVARAKGARVVLKPNLVEFSDSRPINTDPRVIGATAEAFRQLGAGEVVIAEGPGHRRDTELLLEQTGLDDVLGQLGLPFVDLNMDGVIERTPPANLTELGTLKLAGTAASADLLVSVAKLKTHHWAGATLTMKNLFGTVPGHVYGWPKNPLHWAGIPNSIVDIWMALKPGFGIVDGIVGMEGDGPIMGTAKKVGALIMGEQLPAVDATAARLMKLDAGLIRYLWMSSFRGGTLAESRIETIGDTIAPVAFDVIDSFAHLKLD